MYAPFQCSVAADHDPLGKHEPRDLADGVRELLRGFRPLFGMLFAARERSIGHLDGGEQDGKNHHGADRQTAVGSTLVTW
jgi:hypothetical protein